MKQYQKSGKGQARMPAKAAAWTRLKPACLAVHLALGSMLAISASTQAAEVALKSYQIPAGSLAQVLNRYAQQAGVLISYDAGLVKNLSSPGLQGQYDVDAGFARLLDGSGLQVKRNAAGYVLEAAPKAAAPDSAAVRDQTLPEVAVVANEERMAVTENTGSYTTGETSTATRLGLSLRETPQSVSVITRQQMDDRALLGLSDVLRQTTGISVNQNGSDVTDGVQYYSRGFAVENYMIDGIPLSISESWQYQVSDLAFYDRVEVVRGATGLMSGVGTPSAAINLVRKRPTKEFQASVIGMAGSWDNFRGEADVSGSLNEDGSVRGRMVGVRQSSNSFIDRMSSDKEMFYGILEVDLTPSLLFSAGLEYQKYTSTSASRAGLPLFFSDGSRTNWSRSANSSASWADFNHEQRSYFASLEKRFDNDWLAKVVVNQRRSDYDALLGYAIWKTPNTDGTGMGMYKGSWLAKPKQNSIDAYATGPFSLFGREHELVVGVTASKTSYQRTTSTGWARSDIDNIFTWNGDTPGYDGIPVTGSGAFDSHESGAYTTVRLKPVDDLSIMIGSRVSNWSTRNFSWDPSGTQNATDARSESGVVTPYAGVVYDLNRTWSVYASYTDIFKPQTNRGSDGTFLDPLTGSSKEAGVKSEFFNRRLNFSAAVFEIQQDNLAQLIPGVTIDGNSVYRAVSGTKSRGFEAEVSGELRPGWQVVAGLSHSRAKDKDGELLNTYVPQNTIKLFTTYRMSGVLNKLTVGGGTNWQSKTYTDGLGPNGDQRFTQDAYAVVDLMARYQVDSHLSAALNINNVFDKSYYSTTSSSYFGTPRNAMLTLKYQF
jgi:outer-membrane receptor for ferric coprogen and ferric-rhodotorulic acid